MGKEMREADVVAAYLPLTPKVFHILLALAGSARNGYELGLSVEDATRGTIRIGPGTLYENLSRLKERGLIREESLTERTDGRGQRFWTLTELGLGVLRAEVDRLRSDLHVADGIAALQESRR